MKEEAQKIPMGRLYNIRKKGESRKLKNSQKTRDRSVYDTQKNNKRNKK